MTGKRESQWLQYVSFLVLAIAGAASAQTVPSTTVPVTVQVNDQTGAVVPGAVVQVDPAAGSGGKTVCSDRVGQAVVELTAGEHALSVLAPGFLATNRKIEVAEAGTITAVLSVGPSGSGPVVVAEPASPVETQHEAMAGVVGKPATAPATLTVVAGPGQRGVFTLATLQDYPHQTVTIFDHHTNANETFSGVPLMDLLAKLGVPHGEALHGKTLTDYVVATGSDWYKSVVALAEVDPEFHPGMVLVADAMDGKPLGGTGPFRLVVSEDKRPARSVRNLVSIEVRAAE